METVKKKGPNVKFGPLWYEVTLSYLSQVPGHLMVD